MICLVTVFVYCTFVLSGPDAVQFIVNHAAVEAIFCVPQTLSIVSFNHFSLSTFVLVPKIKFANEAYDEAACQKSS